MPTLTLWSATLGTASLAPVWMLNTSKSNPTQRWVNVAMKNAVCDTTKSNEAPWWAAEDVESLIIVPLNARKPTGKNIDWTVRSTSRRKLSLIWGDKHNDWAVRYVINCSWAELLLLCVSYWRECVSHDPKSNCYFVSKLNAIFLKFKSLHLHRRW